MRLTTRDRMWASAMAGMLAMGGVAFAVMPSGAAAETTTGTCCCVTDPSPTASPSETAAPSPSAPTSTDPVPSPVETTTPPATTSPSPTATTPVTYPVALGWSAPGGTATSINDMTTRYGAPAVARIYSTPGAGLKSWTGTVMGALPRDAAIMYSFKDWPVDVSAWMTSRPADWHTTVYLTLDHEPEQGTTQGDPTPADYRAEWAALVAQVANNPRRAEYKLTPVFTEYYAKRNADTFWSNFGQVSALPGVDAVGFDVYDNDGKGTAYRAPSEAFSVPLSYARRADVRKPLILAEWGVARRPTTDASGAGAAQAMRDSMTYLRAQPDVPFVAWWYEDIWHLHNPITADGVTFTRTTEATAFRDLMSSNP